MICRQAAGTVSLQVPPYLAAAASTSCHCRGQRLCIALLRPQSCPLLPGWPAVVQPLILAQRVVPPHSQLQLASWLLAGGVHHSKNPLHWLPRGRP